MAENTTNTQFLKTITFANQNGAESPIFRLPSEASDISVQDSEDIFTGENVEDVLFELSDNIWNVNHNLEDKIYELQQSMETANETLEHLTLTEENVLSVSSGGTGANNTANARENLNVYSKNEVYHKNETYPQENIINANLLEALEVDTPADALSKIYELLQQQKKSEWTLLAEYINPDEEYTFDLSAYKDKYDEFGFFLLGGGEGGGISVSNDSQAFSSGGRSGGLQQFILPPEQTQNTSNIICKVGKGGLGTVKESGTSTAKSRGVGTSSIITLYNHIGEQESYTSDRKDSPINYQKPDINSLSLDKTSPYGLTPNGIIEATGFITTSVVIYNIGDYRNTHPQMNQGRNIFDSLDAHIYCGAGGSASAGDKYFNQDGPSRARGHAGSGYSYSKIEQPSSSSLDATAPGDGGGSLAYDMNPYTSPWKSANLKAGNGADGLIMIYGRKSK